MFGSFYFFYKYLKLRPRKQYRTLFISLGLLFLATLSWGGSLYYLIYFSLLDYWLILLSIPLLLIFFPQLSQPLIPNPGVDENNPLRFVRQMVMFFTIFLMSNRIKSIPKNKWLMALPLLIVGLLSPKFLILLTPLVPLLLIHAWKKADPFTKDWMVPLASIIGLIYILQIGIGWHGPYDYEHSMVEQAIQTAQEENKVLENSWGLGHLIFYHNGLTTKHSGMSEITCTNCIILSYDEFPNCELLREEQKLMLYNC